MASLSMLLPILLATPVLVIPKLLTTAPRQLLVPEIALVEILTGLDLVLGPVGCLVPVGCLRIVGCLVPLVPHLPPGRGPVPPGRGPWLPPMTTLQAIPILVLSLLKRFKTPPPGRVTILLRTLVEIGPLSLLPVRVVASFSMVLVVVLLWAPLRLTHLHPTQLLDHPGANVHRVPAPPTPPLSVSCRTAPLTTLWVRSPPGGKNPVRNSRRKTVIIPDTA